MPRALTLEEKKAKVEEKLAAKEEALKPVGRRTRGAFNGTEGKLRVNKVIEGYHMHILNDSPGRIQTALDNGYEFISPDEIGGTTVNVTDRNTDLGDKVRFLVGKDEQGGPLYAYLMKIKQEWYEEDAALVQNRNDMIDDSIRHGKLTGDGKSTEGFYMPREGIKMKT